MASDPSVDACNDIDSLPAVVDHGCAAGPSTCKNGDHALAVVDSPGLETNSITHSNVWPPLQ